MLVQFSVENFRSLRDKGTFSLVANKGDEFRETNVCESRSEAVPDLLLSAAIYGANAAGKTNILRGLRTMQQIVLDPANAKAPASYNPYKFSRQSQGRPTRFEVVFVQGEARYEFGFSYDSVRVVEEWLYEARQVKKSRKLYERIYDQETNAYKWKFGRMFEGKKSIWQYSTRQEALFLSTSIQLNNTQLKPIYEWFQKKLVIIADFMGFNPGLTLALLEQPEGKERVLPFLNAADLGIKDVQTEREPAIGLWHPNAILEQKDKGPLNVVQVRTIHSDEDGESVDLNLNDESSGTQTLFRSIGAWLNVLANGEVLLFDEIGANLHTLITVFLIRRFHSKEHNPHNAQLIFSTHNTALLSQGLLRRDQVWFTERDSLGASSLTPLSDYSTRKDENLEKAYLLGRFSALPLIDERF